MDNSAPFEPLPERICSTSMNRVVGIETEYGCLVSGDPVHGTADAWPARVKNYLFKKAKAGVIDLHYRDYEEPPGNGGFLLNGGRLYIDMGHLEYSSPECRTVRDAVAYDMAGDLLLQSALEALGVSEEVAFIKNNVDHHTGATFGCHENYPDEARAAVQPALLGTLLSFLATRQIFTGAGRVGQASPLAFDFEPPRTSRPIDFQLSQRADHIVNDIYQWVQFNRAIINARDEPLADYRKYRRLHLLIGDSNMSPFARAESRHDRARAHSSRRATCPTTSSCAMRLWRRGKSRTRARAARRAPRTRPDHAPRARHPAEFLAHAGAVTCARRRTRRTDWILESWAFTLDALRPESPNCSSAASIGISKRWMLEHLPAKAKA